MVPHTARRSRRRCNITYPAAALGIPPAAEDRSDPVAAAQTTAVAASSPAPALTPYRVIVADGRPLFRRGLARLLEQHGLTVVAEARSGPEAVEQTVRLAPDVVLMDLDLPGVDGIEAARQIAAAHSDARVLALTVRVERSTVLAAFEAGVAGYILKDAPIDVIVGAVGAVARGESPLAPQAARLLVALLAESGSPAAPAPAPDLTEREREILALLARGCANNEIARQLFISPHTVKTHVSAVLTKLGVTNRVQAVVRAYGLGLLVADEPRLVKETITASIQ